MDDLSMYIAEEVLDIELEDDDSDEGGIAFIGETVEDFLLEAELPFDIALDKLNEILGECGIKPVGPPEYYED